MKTPSGERFEVVKPKTPEKYQAGVIVANGGDQGLMIAEFYLLSEAIKYVEWKNSK